MTTDTQTKETHSPGPWITIPAKDANGAETEILFVYAAPDGRLEIERLIALVYSNGRGSQAANARVIAQAPTLFANMQKLAALQPLSTATAEDLWLALGEVRRVALDSLASATNQSTLT